MNFKEKVLNLTKKIPRGKISTYGIIAKKLKTSPRAVGQALKRNTRPIVIPCHRVVKSDGSLGGYSRGQREKIKLLGKEGITINKKKIEKFQKIIFTNFK